MWFSILLTLLLAGWLRHIYIITKVASLLDSFKILSHLSLRKALLKVLLLFSECQMLTLRAPCFSVFEVLWAMQWFIKLIVSDHWCLDRGMMITLSERSIWVAHLEIRVITRTTSMAWATSAAMPFAALTDRRSSEEASTMILLFLIFAELANWWALSATIFSGSRAYLYILLVKFIKFPRGTVLFWEYLSFLILSTMLHRLVALGLKIFYFRTHLVLALFLEMLRWGLLWIWLQVLNHRGSWSKVLATILSSLNVLFLDNELLLLPFASYYSILCLI